MKTFEEACELVFCRKIGKDNADTAEAALKDAQERFFSLTLEITDSMQAAGLVEALFQIHSQTGMSVGDIIKNAFAQGVAVGIEMERAENSPIKEGLTA